MNPLTGVESRHYSQRMSRNRHWVVALSLLAGITTGGVGHAAADPPFPTTLTITRSAGTVTYGQWLTLAGQLTEQDTAQGVADAPVELYYRRRGAEAWTPWKTLVTSPTGRWSTSARPASHIDYVARYPGSLQHAPAESRVAAVTVRASISATLSTLAALRGRRVTLSGRVRPDHDGRLVNLQEWYAGAWRSRAWSRLSSDSTYSFPIARDYGIYDYRAVKPADHDHARAISTKRRLQVYARRVTYTVCFRGAITVSRSAFAEHVAKVYGDRRGWARAGMRFVRPGTGCNRSDADLVAMLATPDVIGSTPGCPDRNYSCRSGNTVLINQTRWRNGPTARGWDIGLANYRSMVINHETGHWLGLRHWSCPGAGRPAPVMQQQSVNLRGCRPNPWPTAPEIRAATP